MGQKHVKVSWIVKLWTIEVLGLQWSNFCSFWHYCRTGEIRLKERLQGPWKVRKMKKILALVYFVNLKILKWYWGFCLEVAVSLLIASVKRNWLKSQATGMYQSGYTIQEKVLCDIQKLLWTACASLILFCLICSQEKSIKVIRYVEVVLISVSILYVYVERHI